MLRLTWKGLFSLQPTYILEARECVLYSFYQVYTVFCILAARFNMVRGKVSCWPISLCHFFNFGSSKQHSVAYTEMAVCYYILPRPVATRRS
jgi:hypothetical protein